MSYAPELLTLPRGWFGFVFKSPEDSTRIIENFWVFEGVNLMLKRWRLKFDSTTEYFSYRQLWVLLPGLPLQLWNSKALEPIGNVFGRFIKIDEESLLSRDRRMEKILVEVVVHGGL